MDVAPDDGIELSTSGLSGGGIGPTGTGAVGYTPGGISSGGRKIIQPPPGK
jgi:hypothetical protein